MCLVFRALAIISTTYDNTLLINLIAKIWRHGSSNNLEGNINAQMIRQVVNKLSGCSPFKLKRKTTNTH